MITAIAMFALLGIAAMAIDAASWYQKHHQAQVAADAASLAAANCLANGGSEPPCTSTTDTTDAKNLAVTIAKDNGLTITTGQVSISTTADTVSVADSTTAPSFFAHVAGIAGSTQSANAGARYQLAVAGTPYAVFGMENNCSADAVSITAGSISISGGVHSNSSLYLDLAENGEFDQLSYGSVTANGKTTNCSYSTEGDQGGGTPYNDGPPTEGGDITSWPVAYNTSAHPLPTCTDTYTGSGTWDLPSPSSQTTPEVYCYTGGTILLTGQEYEDDTFICGSISPQGGGVTLDAANYPSNQLLIYATASGTAVNFSNGDTPLEGDVDAPNGSITIDAGGSTYDGLLEAQQVTLGGGGNTVFRGDGPTVPGTGVAGSDDLNQ